LNGGIVEQVIYAGRRDFEQFLDLLEALFPCAVA
jgi:hypothetical protein